MRPWISLALVAAAAAAALAACSRDATGGSFDGAELYGKLCVGCHGETGRPPEAMATRLGVRDLTGPELRARITPALVEKQLREGSENKLMPAFGELLRPEQLRALAAYVASPAFLTRAP